MGRNNSSAPDINDASNGGAGDLGFHSIRDRFRFKRNPNPNPDPSPEHRDRAKTLPDRPVLRNRSHYPRFSRKGLWLFPFRGKSLFYFVIVFAVFVYAVASMVLQSSILSVVLRQGSERGRSIRDGLRLGSTLRFVPRKVVERGGLDRVRAEARIGVRAPRIAIVLGNMKKDSQSLMLFTVMKNLQKLGYMLKIYAVENGQARSMWEQMGGLISILDPELYGRMDWSIFEGIVVDSLEAKEAISRSLFVRYHLYG